MSTKLAARPPRERLSSLKRPRPDRNTPSVFSSGLASASASASIGAIGRPAVRRACPNPTCSTPDIQEIDGERACISCGTIINDSNIVAEVTFGESSAGAAVVQGGFVGEGQRHARSLGPGFRRSGGHGESREVTEYHGREEIRKLGSAIRVFQAIEDQAFSIYKLAAANNFIQGRRTRSVAAVCLYVACRRDKTNTILLMDLAELIQVNIFKLGEVYKDLMKDLWLGDFSQSGVTPVIEVEPLILKFARKLEFGNQYRKVAEDAVKILKRMKRDWMVTGRRPAGLCGACIILAARMNNYRRTVREVVYVVKVADMTIAKRLEEFERTRSSTLTVEEFRKYGLLLKTQHDPPALHDAARQKEKKRKSSEATIRSSKSPPVDGALVADTSARSQRSRRQPRRDADGFVIPDRPIDPNLLAASNIAHSELQATGDTSPEDSQSDAPNSAPSNKRKQRDEDTHEVDNNNKTKKKKKAEPLPLTPQDLLAEEELESEINQIITDPETLRNAAEEAYLATQDHAKALAEQMRGQSAVSTDEVINPDEFADDPEVSNCVLSPHEISIKERIWVTHNEDWLRAQQAKILKKTLEEASGGGAAKSGSKNNGNNKKKQKRSRMGDGSVLEGGDPILTPADANQRMLMKRSKGFSKLINYEKLNKIYEGFVGEIDGGGGGNGGGSSNDDGDGDDDTDANDNDDNHGAAAAVTTPAAEKSLQSLQSEQSVASADEPYTTHVSFAPPSPSQDAAAQKTPAPASALALLPTPPNTQTQTQPSNASLPTPQPSNANRNPNASTNTNTNKSGKINGNTHSPTAPSPSTQPQVLPLAEKPVYEIDSDDDDDDEEEDEEEEEEEEEPDLEQVVDEFGVVRDDAEEEEDVDDADDADGDVY